MPAPADILAAVQAVQDPILKKTLGHLKMVKNVDLQGNVAAVSVELPTPAYPAKDALAEGIRAQVQTRFPEISAVKSNFTADVKGKNSGGNVGLSIRNVIAVGSGKGGVGKSTVAATLAHALQHFGARVGLLDADVYGPSIPHLVGAQGQPGIRQYQTPEGGTFERIEPILAAGLKVMSMGFMVGADQAVIWRGPMLHKALTQFMRQTDWGDLDYLIVDMPPGTGDVALTLSQMVSLAGAVVVCTPQQVALLDAGKAISMFNTVKIPILGMVENMTGDIFGRGGAKAKAESMGVPCLGEIPMDPILRILGDEGRIADLFTTDNAVRQPLLDIASNTAMRIAAQLLENPSLPTLEIL